MTWRRRAWAALAGTFAAMAALFLWSDLRPRLTKVAPDEPLCSLLVNGRYGVFTCAGVEVLPPVWDYVREFRGDPPWASVERNGKCGWIDREGHVVAPLVWDRAGDFDEQGWALVQAENRWRWIDRTGKEVLALDAAQVSEFDAQGWAPVRRSGAWGWIDRQGRTKIDWGYLYSDCEPFDDHGWASVQRREDQRWGCIDRTGALVLPFRSDTCLSFDARGWSPCSRDGDRQYGFIDRAGRETLPFVWMFAHPFDDTDTALAADTQGRMVRIDRQGRVVVAADRKFSVFPSPYYHRPGGYTIAYDIARPWAGNPTLEKLAETVGAKDWPMFKDRVNAILDRDLRIVWRGDLYALRFLLLPAASVCATAAIFCVWRWVRLRRCPAVAPAAPIR